MLILTGQIKQLISQSASQSIDQKYINSRATST